MRTIFVGLVRYAEWWIGRRLLYALSISFESSLAHERLEIVVVSVGQGHIDLAATGQVSGGVQEDESLVLAYV